MEYFELTQGTRIRNPINIIWGKEESYKYNATKEEFDNYPELNVAYYEYNDMMEYPEIIEKDSIWIGETVKDVFKMYDETLQFKGIQIYPIEMLGNVIPSYWTTYLPRVKCLHESCSILPNGEPKDIILDSRLLNATHIFSLEQSFSGRIIVSLPVAESLLRRCPFGITLKKVKVI